MAPSSIHTLSTILSLPSSARTTILRDALDAYPSYISPKLSKLDTLRYETIPALLQNQNFLSKPDLLSLVDWKLSHGKFRPSLRGLVLQNSESAVEDVTRRGIDLLRKDDKDVKGVLKILQELKGIGPATASLLMSCADAEGTVFFGDEVYQWVCGSGGKMGYTVKEYVGLWERVKEIRGTLGLNAVEIEKVGYVWGKRLKIGACSTGEAKKGSGKRKAEVLDKAEEHFDEAREAKHNAGSTGKKDEGQVESSKKVKMEAPAQGTRKSSRTRKS